MPAGTFWEGLKSCERGCVERTFFKFLRGLAGQYELYRLAVGRLRAALFPSRQKAYTSCSPKV
jgi:hypothetical protein